MYRIGLTRSRVY